MIRNKYYIAVKFLRFFTSCKRNSPHRLCRNLPARTERRNTDDCNKVFLRVPNGCPVSTFCYISRNVNTIHANPCPTMFSSRRNRPVCRTSDSWAYRDLLRGTGASNSLLSTAWSSAYWARVLQGNAILSS